MNSELQTRGQNLVSGLQSQGVSMEQYMAMTGQDPATLTEGLQGSATTAVKVDLALRAVADAEAHRGRRRGPGGRVRPHRRAGRPEAHQVRKAYERSDAVSGLRAEIRKAKALEWLLRHVEIVDTEGAPIDRDLLLPPDEDARRAGRRRPRHEHDHAGHDHDHATTTTTATARMHHPHETERSGDSVIEPMSAISSPRWSSRPTGASAPTTSTRGC